MTPKDTTLSAVPDCNLFRRAAAKFATGITIVTTRAVDGTPHGFTANSFTSVSLDPLIVLVCVDFRCSVLPHLRTATHFGINVLSEEQQALSTRFAELPEGRFTGVDWYASVLDIPLIMGTLARFECRRSQIVEIGDHAVLVGEVVNVEVSEGRPLLFFDSRYLGLDF